MRISTFGLLLSVLLASCVPAFEEGAPELHDVALYDAAGGTLYGYFYGEPAELSVGGQAYKLTQGASEDPLSVPGALLIDGAPYLEQAVAPLGVVPAQVSSIPLSTDLMLRTNEAVRGSAYFDGSAWFTLLDGAVAGFEARVVPLERPDGLYGLGELTREEAQVFQRLLEARGPVVVTALSEVVNRTRQANGLGDYKHTALYIQERLSAVNVDFNEPSPVSWEILASGTQATGGESMHVELLTSRTDLERVWNLAYGTVMPKPALPDIDFGSSSVAAFFLGSKRTGGYGVDVQDVAVQGGEARVQLTITEPAAGTFTTQALTHPWVMLTIGRPNLGSAAFEDSSGEVMGVARSVLGK